MFSLRVKSNVEKDVRRFSTQDLQRIDNEIKALKVDPLPPGVKKIKKGAESHYRIRQGDFRIGYYFDPTQKLVEIIYVRRKSETTYR